MLSTLVVLLTLAADPGAEPSEAQTAAATADAARGPAVELLIPEQMIEDFLTAAVPYKTTVIQNVNVFGFAKKVQLNLRLTDPKVKVTPDAVFVTFAYDLKGPGGITSRGKATPRMDLRVIEGKGQLEGRLTGAKLAATGGLDIPVDDLIEPIRFPAVASGPLSMGDTKLQAEVNATGVELEKGQVRVKGRWTFAPAASADSDKKEK